MARYLFAAIKLGFKILAMQKTQDQHHPPRAEFGGRVDSGSEHFSGTRVASPRCVTAARDGSSSGRVLGRLQCTISPTALVSTLRVGDQQLVEIAKALSLRASVLIMDEPTSALTETEVARLYRVIDKLASRRRYDPLHLAQDGRGVSTR